MAVYNKLVRDKIPEIITEQGQELDTVTLDEANYEKELKKKLSEEVSEYLESTEDNEALEELADILELLQSLASIHGGTINEVEEIRVNKAEKKGGFERKVFLKSVED
ncbi:nucleoside triphosphate pyrophosphohydrolase [Aquisalibacillus elongatus]|uniref:Putative house-cleaning noncanonical NTP pyrophosphatase (MazG superfamily) n=1 Tax=Aquisalibacillus elongatus TaxID=485577 RepID=A0A3N5CAV1_9BACI|nr:nucleoside triphosphate pyrophosphohydrolase [Aquisalibacillus elongatus]RPF53921.1 putative house-cleaning noncanonical NTP pyrophosphatase (MazG superfamily) [Aquisalibacillus elongatus]